MREIVLDTETTGLDPKAGHRVIEIACIELVNHLATGRSFREYLNPERDIPEEAARVHGLTADFLVDKPRFAEIVDRFLDFIAGDRLIIHNADFDLAFLNAELERVGRPPLQANRAVDTIVLARTCFPGAQASLDALCRRFGIDCSARSYHGALLDCELLAEVYLELCGGRQPALEFAPQFEDVAVTPAALLVERARRPPRPHVPTAEELVAHERLVAGLEDPIWRA